ncbi:MAG TPA: TlpA disulfide reductase family protein, partial [Candidatus Sulfopaludibacter sp.]|nr:TlpA disulfide reductase family protein [Candidatus Sulfopaludibacter sp.]
MRRFPKFLVAALASGHLWAQGPESAASILRSALKATEKIDTIEYEVSRDAKGPDGKLHRSRSTIIAARSPFGFQSRFRDEDSGARDMAVLDGEVTRYSADGVAGEIPRTFVSAGQIVPNRAAIDVAATWHVLLDRDYLLTAIDSGSIVYAGKDDIDGELCRTVLYVRVGEASGSTVDWYWIGDKSGMPRAVQRVALRRGTTRLVDRAVISIVRTNFRIPPDTFTYRPSPEDSTPAAPSTHAAEPRNLQGTHLPDLEVKDAAYNSLKLSDLVGMPHLITFWAPWCVYCIKEMEALAKLEPAYYGKLRVVAIAVQDSRLNVLTWMKENQQFDFTFLTDPELPETASRLSTYFDTIGIPVSVLVDSDGIVMDRWFGFRSADELKHKLGPFLQPSP